MNTGSTYWGIDPSTSKTGWAILNDTGDIVKSGIAYPGKLPTMARILVMRDELDMLMFEYPPARAAIEEPFMTAKNPHSSLVLSVAFSAMMLLCIKHQVPYITVKPTTVKARAGNGRFTKAQMRDSAQRYFNMDRRPGEDEADALWVATIARSSEWSGEKGVTNWLE